MNCVAKISAWSLEELCKDSCILGGGSNNNAMPHLCSD